MEKYDIAKELLVGKGVIVAGAVDFPEGLMELDEKLKCIRVYVEKGFKEIDYVVNQEAIQQKFFDAIEKEMSEICKSCIQKDVCEKVIVEMCKLDEEGKRIICEIAKRVKSAFLKTSTGKSFVGAKLEDVRLMKSNLEDDVKIKAAGGIKTYGQAKAFIEAGACVLGASAGITIVEEERMRTKIHMNNKKVL